jgi:hypothetical protein
VKWKFRMQVKFERPPLNDEINADLWAGNRRKDRISWMLFVFGFVSVFMGFMLRKLGLLNPLGLFVLGAGAAAVVGDRGFYDWARREREFLERPEPEEPPSLMNWRKPK